MNAALAQLLHHTVCGGLAAAGFGVLFNAAPRALPWCAAGGALALAVRTAGMDAGWSFEASSFAAALAVGFGVQMFQTRASISRNALGVAGCIPMVPGSFAAKAILGFFALTVSASGTPGETLVEAVTYFLRLMFTVGAIGTGLAIPTFLLRVVAPPNKAEKR